MFHRRAVPRSLSFGLVLCALIAAGCDDDTNPTPTSNPSDGGGGMAQNGGAAPGGGGSGGSPAEGGNGGQGGSCDPGEGGSGGALDEADPCNGFVGPRVAWTVVGDPAILLEQPTELLWGFQFAVAVPDVSKYTLEHIRCEQPAGSDETCTTFEIPLEDPACAVMFAPKFGVDPSQYAEGDNRYSFTMRLLDGCDVVSIDSFPIVLTYNP